MQEDAATAEIARVQLWQWVKYSSKTVSTPHPSSHSTCPNAYHLHLQDSGKTITPTLLEPIFAEECQAVKKLPGISADHVNIAKEYMTSQLKKEWPSDFLTSDLYAFLEGEGGLPKGRL